MLRIVGADAGVVADAIAKVPVVVVLRLDTKNSAMPTTIAAAINPTRIIFQFQVEGAEKAGAGAGEGARARARAGAGVEGIASELGGNPK
jgi:hypothetical protein